jgi:hypothetical protein
MRLMNEKRRTSSTKTYGMAPRKKGQMNNLISPETISALQDEIEYYWNVYRIDSYYTTAYMDCLSKLHIATYIQLLAKEIENMRSEKAAIQRLYVTMQKREESLASVSDLAQFLATTPKNPSSSELISKVRLPPFDSVGEERLGKSAPHLSVGGRERRDLSRTAAQCLLPRRQ